jgi:hypothetical protein
MLRGIAGRGEASGTAPVSRVHGATKWAEKLILCMKKILFSTLNNF